MLGRLWSQSAADLGSQAPPSEVRCAMVEAMPSQVEAGAAGAPGEEVVLKPGFVNSGSGYRAVVTSGERVVWSCRHVHFTDHSARADAERHLKQLDDARAAALVR